MKVFLSVLLILLLILSLALGVDESAMKLQDEALDRAMIAFGLAKGLNAIISLIQGTELSLTPVGIGLNFSVGEVLDPFNDMVERFSWVMLASTVSLGIQKILLTLSSKIFLQAAIVIATTTSLIFLWVKPLHVKWFFILPFKILLLLLILRFGAILSIYTSEALYNSVLHVEYEKSTEIVTQTQTKLEVMHSVNTKSMIIKEQSTYAKIKNTFNEAKAKLDIEKQLKKLDTTITKAWKNIINLITIFVVQSIILPLIFIWLMLISIKSVFRVKLNTDKISLILK